MNIFKLIFGYTKEIGLAITILKAVSNLLDSLRDGQEPNVAQVSRLIYKTLPGEMKPPKGGGTELEFTELVFDGFRFFKAIQKFLTK